jgi:hypothetical protein
MQKSTFVTWFLIIGFSIIIPVYAHASTIRATDSAPRLISGQNLLAIGIYEDSPGSTDATLIVQLLADGKILIDEGSPVKYIEPKRDIPNKENPIGWAMPGFDDSDWKDGVYGIGYGDGDDKTVVGSKETTRSIYTRAYFNIHDASKIKKLTLNVDYDDSVVVWLNGVEIVLSLPTELPEIPHWDDQCGDKNTHEASKKTPPVYETVVLEFDKGVRVRPESPLDQLASDISGAVVYSHDRHIYKVVIGDWNPVDLGRGEYARWSPDGKKIAVYDRRKIFAMNADGSNRRLVTSEAWQDGGCPIEFHANCREIIFFRRGKMGLWAVDIQNGQTRKMIDLHRYTGEPGISGNGERMVCRSARDVYAIDLVKKTNHVYAKSACSSSISPDGKLVMNNTGGHKSIDIRSWDGKRIKVVSASICQPDGQWDNHHWSNHNDYICAQGDGVGESYVIKLSTNRGTRVTWVGHTSYPDLYVADTDDLL